MRGSSDAEWRWINAEAERTMNHDALTTLFAGIGALGVVVVGLTALMRGSRVAGEVIQRMDSIHDRVERLHRDMERFTQVNAEAHRTLAQTSHDIGERVTRLESRLNHVDK
jgi:DNA anti-recombination protein RmuC